VPILRRISRSKNGRFRLSLEPHERDILRTLPSDLREILDPDDPGLRRLFPPAYLDDPESSEEFDRLMRQDLLDSHLHHLDVLESTADATELDEEQLEAWMNALNALRLALGTRLEVTEDMYDDALPESDPRYPAFALYLYLGWLQEQVVKSLSAGLDPAGTAEPPPGLPG